MRLQRDTGEERKTWIDMRRGVTRKVRQDDLEERQGLRLEAQHQTIVAPPLSLPTDGGDFN